MPTWHGHQGTHGIAVQYNRDVALFGSAQPAGRTTPAAKLASTTTAVGSTSWQHISRHEGIPRPATAHPSPSLPTTYPGSALAGLGTHGSAGGGRWSRQLVAGVVGGGGVRGRHGHHHGHPHRQRQNTTTRPSLCNPYSPRGSPWSLLIAHTRESPIGAHGR